MQRVLAGALLACLINNAPALAKDKTLSDIPLKWTPTATFAEMGPVRVGGPLMNVKIHLEAFTDVRENQPFVAENREKAGKFRQVTTSDNVAAFVTEHYKDVLSKAGFTLADDSADVIVTGEIQRFFVTETNTYQGEIAIAFHLKNPKGQELWRGTIGGVADHFGRSYRADNYYETFSDSILRAVYNLVADTGFQEAVLKH